MTGSRAKGRRGLGHGEDRIDRIQGAGSPFLAAAGLHSLHELGATRIRSRTKQRRASMATEYLGERGIREREEAEGEDGRRRQGAGLRVDGGDKADEGAVGVAKLVREQRSSGCSCWLLRARTTTAAGGRTRPGPREEEARAGTRPAAWLWWLGSPAGWRRRRRVALGGRGGRGVLDRGLDPSWIGRRLAAVRRLGEGWIGKEAGDWLDGEWEDPEVDAGERWLRRLGGSLEIRDLVSV